MFERIASSVDFQSLFSRAADEKEFEIPKIATEMTAPN